jgi:LuxR family transcriptional regulator, glucitol operon activator
MNGSATRLTLYALISAMETDMRGKAVSVLSGERDFKQVLGPELYEKAFERLQKEHGTSAYITGLKDLVPYFDFPDALQLLQTHCNRLPSNLRQCLSECQQSLLAVVHVRNRVMHSRPLLHDDFPNLYDLAETLASNAETWPTLAQAFCTLKQNPSSVLAGSIPDLDEGPRNHNLPIPDFDETGFLGRDNQASQLLGLLQGPYPVISVIGEGGIGKTALALKVAYDVLDSPTCPFDSVVWVSAKSAMLSPREIVAIEGAIKDSLGILAAVADELAGQRTSDPMEEVLSYLAAFRILLLLDNLETVIDPTLRSFLERLPNGSKVLITSRIGLGDFERRVRLDSLEERDAAFLLRTLAKLRGLDSLGKRTDEQLRGYAKRMKCNPGFIKWFVAAVQAGRRPEEVLADPSLFLDYCLSHVYEYLSQEAKRLLRPLQTIPRPLSLAELAYYTGMECTVLNNAIQQLLSTNMVMMASMKDGTNSETRYALSELAREYLLKKHPLSETDARALHEKENRLGRSRTETSGETRANPHSMYTIDSETAGERIAARYLLDALRAANRHDYSTARDFVVRAKDLSPHFYEVHRVEAYLNALTGNLDEARYCYDHAISIAPKSARLRYWYGGFLLRYMQDPDAALKEFRVGATLMPGDPEYRLEIARSCFQLHDFDQAEKELAVLGQPDDLLGVAKRKFWDTRLQLYQRKAEFALRGHESGAAITALEQFASVFEACPLYIRDRHIADTLGRATGLARRCATTVAELDENERSRTILERLQTEQQGFFYDESQQAPAIRHRGIITRLSKKGQRLGFVTQDGGEELFFHFNSVTNLRRGAAPRIGANMTFEIGMNATGPCAVNCILEG